MNSKKATNKELQKKTLGSLLKTAREITKLSLREVEEVTNISNAYLSQLENEKIKNPSANYLYKLANLYRLNFEELLEKAGVIEPTEDNVRTKKNLNNIALYSNSFTSEEEEELLKYIKFMKSK